MARIFPTIIRRVVAAATGAGQVLSTVVPGIGLSNQISARAPDLGAGVGLSKGPTSLNVPVGTAVALSSINSGTASVTHVPGVGLSNQVAPAPTLSVPAVEIVQVKYDLTKVAGGATQAAVGSVWTNPANALGLSDTVNATSVGSALATTRGIELNYADSVGKAELTILSASLRVFFAVTDALALCTRTLSYNIGAGLVTLETGTGTKAGPSTTYTIPITTWAQFDAFAFRMVTAYGAAAALSNATLDAAELTITATRTDAL